MRTPGGYAVISYDDGRVIERDTIQCKHCQRMLHVKPFQDPMELGGFCGGCSGFVCPSCVGKGCDEIERKLEREEASYHARRSYGLE